MKSITQRGQTVRIFSNVIVFGYEEHAVFRAEVSEKDRDFEHFTAERELERYRDNEAEPRGVFAPLPLKR
jgi:hypothetical protein